MEGVIDNTIKKGTKLKVTLYDLVFQPHRVIEANRRIAIARSKAVERDFEHGDTFHGIYINFLFYLLRICNKGCLN